MTIILPEGRGFWTWQLDRSGSLDSIAYALKVSGVSHVLIKIANGTAAFGITDAGIDLAKAAVPVFKAAGLQVWGWQYIYLFDPARESAIAVARVLETGVDGFVIDAESYCKNKPAQAFAYCDKLRAGLPAHSIGLSSYRFPSLHPELPWSTFRSFCDFDLPQVYWEQAHNAGDQLRRSFLEFSRMSPALPYIPTGAAYSVGDWAPTVADIESFLVVTRELGLTRFNWWEYYTAMFTHPGLWEPCTDYILPGPILIGSDRVVVNVTELNVRSAPVVDPASLIGVTYKGAVWKVTDRVLDSYGRVWVQSGPSVHLAGWLTVEV